MQTGLFVGLKIYTHAQDNIHRLKRERKDNSPPIVYCNIIPRVFVDHFLNYDHGHGSVNYRSEEPVHYWGLRPLISYNNQVVSPVAILACGYVSWSLTLKT